MVPLRNPFVNTESYNCFGCSPRNPAGLAMRFFETHEGVVSRWLPRDEFMGFTNVLHGGIQATLMDELASWTIFVKLETAGVTRAMDIDYRQPVLIGDGEIELRGRVAESDRRSAVIEVKLFSRGEEPASTGRITYALYSPALAARKLAYPGRDAFAEINMT